MSSRTQGFNIAGVLIAFAVVAVAGIIVWRVWPQSQPAASSINSSSDIQKQLDSLDDDTLNKQLDPAQLDDDINEVL